MQNLNDSNTCTKLAGYGTRKENHQLLKPTDLQIEWVTKEREKILNKKYHLDTACANHDNYIKKNFLDMALLGNIKDQAIDEILASKAAEDRRNEMKLCNRNCNNKVNCFFKERGADHGN